MSIDSSKLNTDDLQISHMDIVIFGILVRDVTSDPSDILRCVSSLADSCPVSTNIILYTLYLPSNTTSFSQSKLQKNLQGDGQ